MMLCPTISLNLFEPTIDEGKCPCNMDYCNCNADQQMAERLAVETVPIDPKYNPKRRANNMYNPPKVCITIDEKCTDKSLATLFENGVRLVHIQLALGTRDQVERTILKVFTAIAGHYIKHPSAIPIAMALEIGGRMLRTGRMHNDQPDTLVKGSRVFVTSNPVYSYCSNKDVIFVANLEKYFNRLQVGEFIFINRSKIQLLIIKVTPAHNMLTCCVLRGSQIESNMEVILPYLLDQEASLTGDELDDCAFAVRNKADFIVVPIVSNAEYLQAIREACFATMQAEVFLLTEVEPTCFVGDRCSVDEIIEASDGLWWSKASARITECENRAVCKAKQMCKPIVFALGTAKKNRMHNFLLQDCDCILLNKYNRHIRTALRQQLHVADKLRTYKTSPELQDLIDSKDHLSMIASSSVFSAITLHAHIIVCITFNGKIAIKLSQNRPLCPIVTVVQNRKLARILTIYKNILPTVFKEKIADYSYPDKIKVQLRHGISIAKMLQLVDVGDLVIYCFDSFENADDEDMTTYQVSYLPEELVQN